MPVPRFGFQIGKVLPAQGDVFSDSVVESIIAKCLPIILRTCGTDIMLGSKSVCFARDHVIFPFDLYPGSIAAVKCALLEAFPSSVQWDPNHAIKTINERHDNLVKKVTSEFDEQLMVLVGDIARLEFQLRSNPNDSQLFEDIKNKKETQEKLSLQKTSALKEIETERVAAIRNRCSIFILHETVGNLSNFPESHKEARVRRYALHRTDSEYEYDVHFCDMLEIRELVQLDVEQRAELKLPPGRWWYWNYMEMLAAICKPTSPLRGVFDYRSPHILSREGMLQALTTARYDHREIEERAPGVFHKKTHGDDPSFVDACVDYMNRALFLVCEGTVQYGILKYTKEGIPLFDVKNSKSVEDEFRPLHVVFTHGKSLKPKTYYLFDWWKNSARKNFVKKMSWIPWGGWECSLVKEMDGLDYRCLNRYLGYRYSLKQMADAYAKCCPKLLADLKRVIFNNLCGSNVAQYVYVVKFLARALQLPFCKQGAFLMFVGASGIGKGTIILAVGHLLGNSFYHNKAGEIAKDFNSDFLNRSLIFFDEMHMKKDSYSWLKTAITEPTQRIEEKYKSAEDLPSFWSCVGASNDLSLVDSVIDASDRRFFFADCMKTKSPKHAALAEHVGRQMSADNFLLNKAFGYWLLNVDISDFDASRIPSTRAAKVTQQRSDTSAVYMFLAYCLKTKTILPSPAHEFLRQHNYKHEPATSQLADQPSITRYSNGVPTDLVRSITVSSDDSGVWNPLGLCGEKLEKWKRWYVVDNDSYLIDLSTWEFMKKRRAEKDAPKSKEKAKEKENEASPPQVNDMSLNKWLIHGGWLTVVPCAQLYNRFIKWCKHNGIYTQKWTSAVFSTMFQEALGPNGAISYETVGAEIIQFYEIASHQECQDFFAERFPVFECERYEWKTQTDILDPPLIPLTVLSSEFHQKLEQCPNPSPLVVDFVAHLKKSHEHSVETYHADFGKFLQDFETGASVGLPPPSCNQSLDVDNHPSVKKQKRKYAKLKTKQKHLESELKSKEDELTELRATVEMLQRARQLNSPEQSIDSSQHDLMSDSDSDNSLENSSKKQRCSSDTE